MSQFDDARVTDFWGLRILAFRNRAWAGVDLIGNTTKTLNASEAITLARLITEAAEWSKGYVQTDGATNEVEVTA